MADIPEIKRCVSPLEMISFCQANEGMIPIEISALEAVHVAIAFEKVADMGKHYADRLAARGVRAGSCFLKLTDRADATYWCTHCDVPQFRATSRVVGEGATSADDDFCGCKIV